MEFNKLTLADIETLRPFFNENPSRICDRTIGGTFMWRDYHNTSYTIVDGILYLNMTSPNIAFAPPRGQGVGRDEYQRILDHNGGGSALLCSVSEDDLDDILKLFPDSIVKTDRAWSDYLYLSEDIVNLAGRRYSGQRNHINRFKRETDVWSFKRITGDILPQATAFIEKYLREHTKNSQAYDQGNKKTLEALNNLELYGVVGGALYVEDEIIGLSLGEIVGDTLFIHAEKAEIEHHGSYPMLVNQFAKTFATDGVVYINREEDDGVEGLRTSKLSYHPTALLNKYTVEIRG